ncbi:hydantoinase/oxoprolinase family protein [Amycolatopsis sp. FU40]|uniref:hydantoinase/oxoprolinase family protein n=1 Tax=Amycolatopsis sp. FU40 TaxID=2914159 RepID=UPI001F484771|nr:hydantoinase/oxoprolinase family protein [Amycolatopsis sp. FU40]UKD57677.1 hydantoinase/oxoprolinase family protein [Amycolatopsis sp. FU40]
MAERKNMIGVDVGGTFTDIVSISGGRIETVKVATNVTESYKAVLEGASEVDVAAAAAFNHASTHGLNAVITRRLPKIAFLTTEGHRDILDMARAMRPPEANTDPRWHRSFGDVTAPIVPRYLRRGIRERFGADGTAVIPLDEQQAREELRILARCGVEGVAICLLNSYVDGSHERRLRELVAEEIGDVACSISSEVSPLAREYPRASTTVIDVLMKRIYGPYTRELAAGLTGLGFEGDLNFADCAAMLAPVEVAMERPSRIVFSGPAAGTVACAHLGELIGEPNLICTDIGGTSSDISVVTGGKPFVNTTFELEHDLIVNTLSNEIVSVGAGGGSIVSITPTGEVKVGPESAGADPGPACYGRGGAAPTTTDTFLMMGILDPDRFAAGRSRLDPGLARAAFENLDTQATLSERVRFAYRMALNNVAEGIVDVLVKNGVDPRDHALVAYGAAGPMMLPGLLEQMHVKSVLVPPHPGLFSALGLVSADQVYADSRTAYAVLTPDAAEEIDAVYAGMEEAMTRSLGKDAERVTFTRSFDGQLMGQAWETPFVEVPNGKITPEAVETMIANFHDGYEQRSGNRFEGMPVQGVTYRLTAVVPTPKVDYPEPPRRPAGESPQPVGAITIRHLEETDLKAGEYERDQLMRDDVIEGPAVIREPMSTTFVPPGLIATVGRIGEIVITRATGQQRSEGNA